MGSPKFTATWWFGGTSYLHTLKSLQKIYNSVLSLILMYCMMLLPAEKEGVASFLKLLLSMLKSSPINQQVFFLSEGPATIGALLQKVPPSRITVQTLSAVQDLVEHFADVCEHRCLMYKHLLFDFRIWSRPDFSVRSGECVCGGGGRPDFSVRSGECVCVWGGESRPDFSV